jgi:hypothetical protein
MPDQKHCFRELFDALGRLDDLLNRATKAADAFHGGAPAADPYRGLYITPNDVERMLAREPGAPLLAGQDPGAKSEYPRLARLSERFDLDAFDQDVIVLVAAPEVDLRYERLYAYLHDDVTRKRPSVDLAVQLLCATREARVAARSRFLPGAPLIRHRLVQLTTDSAQPNQPLLAHVLKLDDTVLRYLLCEGGIDARIAAFSEVVEPGPRDSNSLSPLPLDRLESMARSPRPGDNALRFYLEGPKQALKRKVAEAIAGRLETLLLICSLDRMPSEPAEFESALDIVIREAALNDGVLYLENVDSVRDTPTQSALYRKLARVSSLTILEGERPWAAQPLEVVTVLLQGLDFTHRRNVWKEQLEAAKIETPKTVDDLSALHRLGADEIHRAVNTASEQARLAGRPTSEDDLLEAARIQSSRDLGPMAQRIVPVHQWKNLILSEDRLAQLREIANQARYRHVVFDDWGFGASLSLGKGLSALFSGPPGTGKTMAAEVLANDLRLDLYKIDLSQVVSKYIGETEKNLGRVFSQARTGSCILFFDECDALFGKRTEVKDAHDRYANIEIAYLLQKIDEYDGLSILATNLRQNLDPAFTRRLTFIVDFPFPDEASRKRIWQTIWPAGVPRSRELDFEYIAHQFKLSGGSIKNVALGAAFLAAADGGTEVGTKHLVQAARRELEKMGRSMTRAELGRFADNPALSKMLEVLQ